MDTKVFLFDTGKWLYCDDVSFEDDCYYGRVINGQWNMTYNTKTKILSSIHHSVSCDLVWACNAEKAFVDYNNVINDARKRYKKGEPANWNLT